MIIDFFVIVSLDYSFYFLRVSSNVFMNRINRSTSESVTNVRSRAYCFLQVRAEHGPWPTRRMYHDLPRKKITAHTFHAQESSATRYVPLQSQIP